ncbi:hypothetical protein E9549_05440 [Blastococcus sp. MG754426]|uniref:hypothetical protein n=1 Tax=unclassified Blastococcus TaxID=2619396 RepID=UPI001EEFE6D0|nr:MULTISPECIES: hypothetical protein [unclassified Blastococcus]MCF6506850.1 hypothetical protein [Blastococcus sp. MG754426]MCF6511650.1 hypothetical protein [Blastococcus sp. MG754427]
MRRFAGALGVAPTDAAKFDALIGFNSPAYHQVLNLAHQGVDTSIDSVLLKQKRLDPYEVGDVLNRLHSMVPFQNSLHEGYSDLNNLERAFAKALDATDYDWLPQPQPQRLRDSPHHLRSHEDVLPRLPRLARRRCVRTRHHSAPPAQGEDRPQVTLHHPAQGQRRSSLGPLRLPGNWNKDVEQLDQTGYTVWSLKQDNSLRATHVEDLEESVTQALKPL